MSFPLTFSLSQERWGTGEDTAIQQRLVLLNIKNFCLGSFPISFAAL